MLMRSGCVAIMPTASEYALPTLLIVLLDIVATWSLLVTDPAAYRYVAIVKTAAEDLYLNEVRVYR